MTTIALRFGEQFAPPCGTINAHKDVLKEKGFVWYGKLGKPIADNNIKMIMANDHPRILLTCNGKTERYWATLQEIQKDPPKEGIPDYYKDDAFLFKTWFKITAIDKAPDDVMSKCIVVSSKSTLSEACRHSMSPVFVIEYKE